MTVTNKQAIFDLEEERLSNEPLVLPQIQKEEDS